MLNVIREVAIVGLGALGILFGNQITKHIPKENLRIVADDSRIKRYQTDQIYCNDEPCEFHYITPDTKTGAADLVIFAVKNNDLSDAIRAVKNQVGEHTVMMSLLNGITSEDEIGRTYGMDKIVYCIALGMDAVRAGNRMTYQHPGMLCIGDLNSGRASDKVRAAAAFFDKTHVKYEIDNNMSRKLWSKFMLNVGVNQAVAVFGDCYGDVQRESVVRDVMIDAMKEVITLSKIEGIGLNETDLAYWIEVIGRLSPEGKPSMRQDVEACRYSEVDLFSGAVLALGKKHGISTPVNEMLYRRIAELESGYA